MDKLLNCPFCGEPVEQLTAHGFGNYSVSCDVCHAQTGQVRGVEAAIKVWNRRPDKSPSPDAERLAECLQKVHAVMCDDYATIPTEHGFKIDSWKFFRNMAALDDEIRLALADFEKGGLK